MINETNNLKDVTGMSGHEYHAQFHTNPPVYWADPNLARITRLRLLTDPSFPAFDVSYCHGETKDGKKVCVHLPFSQLPKKHMRKHLVEYAKKDKVYAKGLGVFDALSILC